MTFNDFAKMRVQKKATDARRARKREAARANDTAASGVHVWAAEEEETAESPPKKQKRGLAPQPNGDKENSVAAASNKPAEKVGKAASRGRLGMRRDPNKQSKRPKAMEARSLANAAAKQDSDMFIRLEAVYHF